MDFHPVEYRASLELILKAAQEDYKQVTFDRPNRQSTILKTYMWLSSLLFAAEWSFFSSVREGKAPKLLLGSVCQNDLFFALVVMALGCAAIAFILGVDAARGRIAHRYPYEDSYTDQIREAYNTSSYGENPNESLRINMIIQLERGIRHHRKEIERVGRRLRTISRLMLLSVGVGLWIVLIPLDVYWW